MSYVMWVLGVVALVIALLIALDSIGNPTNYSSGFRRDKK